MMVQFYAGDYQGFNKYDEKKIEKATSAKYRRNKNNILI